MSTFATYPSSVPARSTATILGQVMFLVAVALGLCTAGTLIGQDLAPETARVFSFTALGMLLAQAFVGSLRTGPIGIGWLSATALVIGLGLGPALSYVATVDPGALTSAATLTFLTVLGMACVGFTLSKDLASWMRPLAMIVLGCVVVSIIGLVAGGLGALSPLVSLIVLVASALLILVDFNYVRKHATEDDVVWLATGIFVSIVNIFLSFLNLSFDD